MAMRGAWLKDLRLKDLDPNDVMALAACGAEIPSWIQQAPFPALLEHGILKYYHYLENQTSGRTSFAVRSSAIRIALQRRLMDQGIESLSLNPKKSAVA